MPTQKITKKHKTTKDIYRSEITLIERDADHVITQVKILRGYRHQIRSHLAYIGLPIVGDPLYHPKVRF